MITLMVITDGRRDILTETLAHLDFLDGEITRRVVHDDSGDRDNHLWLDSLGVFDDIVATPQRSGFNGAMASARRWLTDQDRSPFVFWLEDDFRLFRTIPLLDMAAVLDERPHLAQMALRRQPVNAAEKRAGGVVEQWPHMYTDCRDDNGREWLAHRQFFTTNPALIPRAWITDPQWPVIPRSEEAFSKAIFTDAGTHCAYWGSRDSGVWVEHIGTHRVGTGY